MELGVVAATLFEWPDSVWIQAYVLGTLLATIVMGAVAFYSWRGRESTAAVALTGIGVGGAVWSLATSLQILSVPYILSRVFMQFAYVGITVTSATWFAFSLAFTNRDGILNKKTLSALSIHPVVFNFLAATNEVTDHYLVWTEIEPGGTIYGFTAQNGVVWYMHTGYSYLLMIGGFVLVLGHFFRHRNVYRHQSAAVLSAFLLNFLSNAALISGLVNVDPTPFAYSFGGVIFFWALFKHDLTDLTPIARRTAWDELEDAVVTLDDEDRVVDANETAKELFGVEQNCEGMPAPVFFEQVPTATLERLADATDTETEITAQIDGEQRYFSLSISPVDDERGQHGRVIVLQDITRLKQREQELDVLRQVQSRVLRHNIRTELSMVRGHAQMVASEVDEAQQERMESIVEAGDRLATISDKARIVEELFEDEQSPREYDIRGSIDQAVANVRAEYPELSVSVTGATECQAKASPHLQTAVENLLENTAEHNDSDQPEATVHLKNGSSKELTISDNGPGIPEQELTVLEKEGEDALEHGSGLGLWLVKWIADRSDADLAFETDDSGTDVRLQFS